MMVSRSLSNSDSLRDDWQALDRWYQQPPGRLFGAGEGESLANVLPFLFGYYLLSLGLPLEQPILSTSPIRQQFSIGAQASLSNCPDFITDPTCLPVASDTIDAVVLSHLLEFSDDPFTTLKEVERILIPEGHAVILGFNPLSPWGVARRLPMRTVLPISRQTHLHSVPQLRAWLAFLGFDTLAVNYHHYHSLLIKSNSDQLGQLGRWRQQWLPFSGAGYLLLARKRVSTFTPIKLRQRGIRPRAVTSLAS